MLINAARKKKAHKDRYFWTWPGKVVKCAFGSPSGRG